VTAFTIPDHYRTYLAEATDLTWDMAEYVLRDAAQHVHDAEAAVPSGAYDRIALLRAAAAAYSDTAQDLDTERDEPGTHRHPLLMAQIRTADRLATEGGSPCGVEQLVAHLAGGEEQLLLDRIAEAEEEPDAYEHDLPRMRAALLAVQAEAAGQQRADEATEGDAS
jgi:hypothetical protein